MKYRFLFVNLVNLVDLVDLVNHINHLVNLVISWLVTKSTFSFSFVFNACVSAYLSMQLVSSITEIILVRYISI